MSDAPRTTEPLDHLDPQVLADYLVRTRWFAGKGRPFDVQAVRRLGAVPHLAGTPDDAPVVVVHLVDVAFGDAAGGTATYQVPLALYTDAQAHLEHAFIGWWEEPTDAPLPGWVHAYDAVHDRDAMALWLRAFDAAAGAPEATLVDEASGLRFRRLPGHDLEADAPATLFSGEQSNSSLFYGDDAVLKLFRQPTPGLNPDVEVHEVLSRADSPHVAALYGWLETGEGDDVVHLAMLQQFLRTATDGWELALASVHDLFAEAFTLPLDPDDAGANEVHAREAGGDFAGESTRLGEAVRAVHQVLAERFGTTRLAADETSALAAGMTRRLREAVTAVPGLAAHAAAIEAVYDRVAALGEVTVQRVHGDLHLGQTLRTSRGWKIVDFEGEPSATVDERRRPDSPWRDVAGMLRSFDYAPRVVERDVAPDHPESAAQVDERAAEWAHRNRNHFLTAYAGGDLDAAERVLLDAYLADKAVYEAVYETRNRPDWVVIPLRAVAEIGAA